jgi:hypothetical protein
MKGRMTLELYSNRVGYIGQEQTKQSVVNSLTYSQNKTSYISLETSIKAFLKNVIHTMK